MSATLHEAMTAGVVVEFYDALGQTIAQSVFTQWQGRPLPAKGDRLCCTVQVAGNRTRKLWGKVMRRQFDVQTTDEGLPSVWAHLDVRVGSTEALPARRRLG
jgi:hypothetical protein